MPQPQRFDILVLGSGAGGTLVARHMAQSGRRTAVVEGRWVGGSCVNVACMPSKNEISSAKVAHLARHAAQYGTVTGAVAVDMPRFFGASARWLSVRLRGICRTTKRAAPN